MKLYTSKGIEILVEEKYIERLSKFRWYFNGRVVSRNERWGGLCVNFPLANEVLQIDRKIRLDHKDRNPLNNYEDNLRRCTRVQNAANVAKRTGNFSSRYKGVYWCNRQNMWRARLMKAGKRINLGHFILEIDAAKAYNESAINLLGEFAVLNII